MALSYVGLGPLPVVPKLGIPIELTYDCDVGYSGVSDVVKFVIIFVICHLQQILDLIRVAPLQELRVEESIQ